MGKLEVEQFIDQRTNLIWAKAEFAQTGDDKKTWENAVKFANNSNLAGYDDWRLPNILEITAVTKNGSSLILPWGGSYGYYWSSTSAGDNNYWSAGNELVWGETSTTSLFSAGGDPSFLCVQIVRDNF